MMIDRLMDCSNWLVLFQVCYSKRIEDVDGEIMLSFPADVAFLYTSDQPCKEVLPSHNDVVTIDFHHQDVMISC